MKHLTLWVSLVVSCSVDGAEWPPPGELFGEGSRLRAIWEQAPGAPKVLRGWYDPELETQCNFRTVTQPRFTTEEETFCLPSSSRGGPITAFADPGCLIPVVPGGEAGGWFEELTQDECGGRTVRLIQLGEPASPGSLYSLSVTGACEPWPASHPGGSFFHVRREVPFDCLVKAAPAVPIGTGRIVPLVREASDGSWEYAGARDEALGTNVVLAADDPFTLDLREDIVTNPRWYPASDAPLRREGPVHFSDPGCSSPVVEMFGCGSSRYMLATIEPRACMDPVRSYYEVGAPIPWSTVFGRGPTGACEPLVAQPIATQFFERVDPLAENTLAPVAITEAGTGRIKLRLVGGEGGPVVGKSGYRDDQAGALCQPLRTADGAVRCLPLPVFDVRFGDAACTEKVVGLESCSARPERVTVYDFGEPGAGLFPSRDRPLVFPVLDATAAALFQVDASGACVSSTPRPGVTYQQLGPELPATDFVELLESPTN